MIGGTYIRSSSGDGFSKIRPRRPNETLPQSVIHYRIQFDVIDNHISFTVKYNPYDQPDGADVSKYMEEILCKTHRHDPPTEKRVLKSPVDLSVWEEAIVIIELDQAANWKFMRQQYGATIGSDYAENYCDLRHYYTDNAGNPTYQYNSPPSGKECRVICFAAVEKPATPGPGHPFNLFIEFDQGLTDQYEENVLQIIVDPDIKDTGQPGKQRADGLPPTPRWGKLIVGTH